MPMMLARRLLKPRAARALQLMLMMLARPAAETQGLAADAHDACPPAAETQGRQGHAADAHDACPAVC